MREGFASPAGGSGTEPGHRRQIVRRVWRLLLPVGLAVLAALPVSGIQFQEVTTAAGISYFGPSWGASWGDFNGDGWPDLFTNNHMQDPPSLYLNLGDGTFLDIMATAWPGLVHTDRHSAAWADFDNDGDQDLRMVTGADRGTGAWPEHLLVNQGGIFTDQAAAMGLYNAEARGRMPVWLDADHDGWLDQYDCNSDRPDGLFPSTLYCQTPGGFSDCGIFAGAIESSAIDFGVLSSLAGSLHPELVLGREDFPIRIFDLSSWPFGDLSTALELPVLENVKDALCADFNGDLRPDLVLPTYVEGSEVVQMAAGTIDVELQVKSNEKGLEFACTGTIFIEAWPRWDIDPDHIFIGASGAHPQDNLFSLSASDPVAAGLAAHQPGVTEGLFVGYDDSAGKWVVLHSWRGVNVIYLEVVSDQEISAVERIGFGPYAPGSTIEFAVQSGEGLIDSTALAGLDWPVSACGGVAADFDNDMDVDFYVVCNAPIQKPPNLLFENDGSGHFSLVPNAGGAAGSSIGQGDSAAAADYDRDGFIDLLTTNGFGVKPFNRGPHLLFRNRGNGNYWLEIDLEGVLSNRDGVGAWVLLTAGGKTQLREASGGMHGRSQDFKRLHFGLGPNPLASLIEVHWPSGVVQKVWNTASNQILRIVEALSPGDLNGDFTMDSQDTQLLANCLAGNLEPGTGGFNAPASAADMNGDGGLDGEDLVLLMMADPPDIRPRTPTSFR